MGATEAFEFDLARCAEPDIGHPLERVPNRVADEDLATTGLSRYSRRHRNVEPEEVVSALTDVPMWMPNRTRMAPQRSALPCRARCTSILQSTACAGWPKAIMNPSPWLFTTWPP
jgi:hypothetical protein